VSSIHAHQSFITQGKKILIANRIMARDISGTWDRRGVFGRKHFILSGVFRSDVFTGWGEAFAPAAMFGVQRFFEIGN
jgi:hypothetical protein